jgi:hypothetical protein
VKLTDDIGYLTPVIRKKSRRSEFSATFFMLQPFPIGIRDADRLGRGCLLLGDQAEYGDQKFVAPECLLRVRDAGPQAGVGTPSL